VHLKLSVAGEDTDHGRLPWLVSSPTTYQKWQEGSNFFGNGKLWQTPF
jgi:hypothetical protein